MYNEIMVWTTAVQAAPGEPLSAMLSDPDSATQSTLLLDPFNWRWADFSNRVADCQLEFSVDAVHDLRVAARRLLAVLEIAGDFSRQPQIKKLRRDLKDLLDGFDTLRDVQVMLAGLAETPGNPPGTEKYRLNLQKREQRLLVAAEKYVRSLQLKTFNRRMLKVQAALAQIPDAESSVKLLRAVDRAFASVLQRYRSVKPDQPATIHRVRVAFKKFRYMLECAHPLLSGFPEENFKRMQAYQTLMGDIQDAEVFMQTLSKYARRHPGLELEELRQYSQQRLSHSLAAYMEHKAGLGNFWRLKPGVEFNWQSRAIEEAK